MSHAVSDRSAPDDGALSTSELQTVGLRPSISPSKSRGWLNRYRSRVVATDIVLIGAAMFVPLIVLHATSAEHARVPFVVLATVAWIVSLAAFDSRSAKSNGTGSHEYKAVIDATLVAVGIVVIIAFVFDMSVRRVDVIPSVPLGLVAVLLGRLGWRRWLHRERLAGRCLNRVILVGSPSTINHAMRQFDRHPESGYLVVGSVVPVVDEADEHGAEIHAEVASAAQQHSADVVMLTSSDVLTPQRIRRLGWDLERHSHSLVVATSLTDIASSRIQTQPVAGLPLIHIEAPTYTGIQRIAKRLFDIVGSAALILIFSPLIVVTALLVKFTSAGPVFYLQERVGKHDETFSIFKFRSMIIDADSRLQELLAKQGTEASPLFKIQQDPRLTRVGAVLRRYSIDELPQLFNVFLGDMSLVGPRPQRPAEVALYDHAAHRRLNVRPGMTGLWQVSGRSKLSWEDAVRLDLYYIENWTFVVDIIILWRTVKAVVGSDGAY